jgi:PAS domain S-box-containing protein
VGREKIKKPIRRIRLAPALLLALVLLLAATSFYELLAFLRGPATISYFPHHSIGTIFTVVVAALILYYLLSLYEKLYRQTQEEIADREHAEEALRQVPTMLEKQVAERTAELARINDELEREISERKRAEAELVASRAKLQLITDQMPGMVWTTDRDLRITEIVGTGYPGLRIQPAVFLGKTLPKIFRGRLEGDARFAAHRMALESRSGRYEIGLRGHQFDVRIEPLRDGAGSVMGCIGIALDVTEEKRLENALQKAKDYAENLIETANVMIVGLDPEGAITVFNEGAEQTTGYIQADLMGKNLLTEVLPRGEYNYVREKFKEWQEGELLLPVTFESVMFSKLGAERFISWQINEVRDQEEAVGAICFGIDITERVKAEREVASRNQELFALYRISEIILGTESIDDAYQAIIEEICLATGFPVGSIEIYDEERQVMIVKGLTGMPQWSGSDRELPLDQTLSSLALKTRKAVIETEAVSRPEYTYPMVQQLGIQTFVCLPMIVQERFVGALTLAHPVTIEVRENMLSLASSLANELAVFTHRIQMDEALKESEERYRKLVENSPDAIIVHSHGAIIFLNAAGIRLLGATSSEEVVGRPFLEFVHPDSVAVVKERHALLEDGGQGLSFIEEKYVRLDGAIMDFEASTVKFSFYGKSALLTLARDITDRKRAEEQIRASLKEKEVLLKEIHHRVKNNLQIVSSLLYLQSRKTSDDQVLSVLRESQTRVRSMALIHEKLYQCDDLANINLGDYIRSLTSYLFNSYGVASHMVTLHVNVDNTPLGLDRAIPCGLIINELVSNALKYAFPNGRRGKILIDLLHGGDGKVVLTVKDNGVGLPGGMDITDMPSLGLQLVNTLVKQLDGTIEVDSVGGAAFRMVLS